MEKVSGAETLYEKLDSFIGPHPNPGEMLRMIQKPVEEPADSRHPGPVLEDETLKDADDDAEEGGEEPLDDDEVEANPETEAIQETLRMLEDSDDDKPLKPAKSTKLSECLDESKNDKKPKDPSVESFSLNSKLINPCVQGVP